MSRRRTYQPAPDQNAAMTTQVAATCALVALAALIALSIALPLLNGI